jgi:hypothetical protein
LLETRREEEQSNLLELETWLSEHFVEANVADLDGPGLESLVKRCHLFRRTSLVSQLKQLTAQDQTRNRDFEQLHKLLYKIAKHVTVTRKLVEAAVALPQDFAHEFAIKTIPSSKSQSLPIEFRKTTVEAITGRMFSSKDEKENFLNRLRSIWQDSDLTSRLHKQIDTKTRVHAELLIINYFDAHGCNFLDGNDRYIGCSKPACYLCYAYIRDHPGRYKLPASHQKLYVAWRVPDIDASEADYRARVELQERILLKLIDMVRHDLTTEIESREPRRAYHADSTIGATSTSDPILDRMIRRAASLSLKDG